VVIWDRQRGPAVWCSCLRRMLRMGCAWIYFFMPNRVVLYAVFFRRRSIVGITIGSGSVMVRSGTV